MSNILIIDDEKAIRKTLSEILSYEGYKIDEAGDGEEGFRKFREKEYDVILCDIKMPKMDGIEFLEKAKELNPDLPIIMISGHGTIETAVEAVKKGAYDYISKPPDLNRLLITIRNAMDKTSLVAETKVLKRKVSRVQDMIGESTPIHKIRETIEKVAPTDARILITGENGVGKELVARWVHEKSNRAAGPLIEVNCAAIPGELGEIEPDFPRRSSTKCHPIWWCFRPVRARLPTSTSPERLARRSRGTASCARRASLRQ